jgi:hypothetical protein
MANDNDDHDSDPDFTRLFAEISKLRQHLNEERERSHTEISALRAERHDLMRKLVACQSERRALSAQVQRDNAGGEPDRPSPASDWLIGPPPALLGGGSDFMIGQIKLGVASVPGSRPKRCTAADLPFRA